MSKKKCKDPDHKPPRAKVFNARDLALLFVGSLKPIKLRPPEQVKR